MRIELIFTAFICVVSCFEQSSTEKTCPDFSGVGLPRQENLEENWFLALEFQLNLKNVLLSTHRTHQNHRVLNIRSAEEMHTECSDGNYLEINHV